MMSRLRGRPIPGVVENIEHPEAIVLAAVLAGLAVIGWLTGPFWLAVAIGIQLGLAGLGAVWIIGPARAGLGLARYATLATASVALTLAGRPMFELGGLLLAPIVAALLWVVLRTELDANRDQASGALLDLTQVAIVFAAAAGARALVADDAWPPSLLLVVVLSAVPVLRTTEARGLEGSAAIGSSLLHLLALGQVGAALALLQPPGVIGAALLALTFHAWGGAAGALEGGEPRWRIAVEFGALALMGLVLAFIARA